MMTLTTSKKHDLIERAKLHYHTQIYLSDKDEYVSGLRCKPDGVTTYRISEVEPVVATKGIYDLEA